MTQSQLEKLIALLHRAQFEAEEAHSEARRARRIAEDASVAAKRAKNAVEQCLVLLEGVSVRKPVDRSITAAAAKLTASRGGTVYE